MLNSLVKLALTRAYYLLLPWKCVVLDPVCCLLCCMHFLVLRVLFLALCQFQQCRMPAVYTPSLILVKFFSCVLIGPPLLLEGTRSQQENCYFNGFSRIPQFFLQVDREFLFPDLFPQVIVFGVGKDKVFYCLNPSPVFVFFYRG